MTLESRLNEDWDLITNPYFEKTLIGRLLFDGLLDEIIKGDYAYEDYIFMSRALSLASLGEGWVNPNPLVGAVIVKDGKIIGEGYHEKYGHAHAEVNAFKDCENRGNDPGGADLYVSLEPCCHYGKTPPCADLIIKKAIKRVFIGLTDPNPKVSGGGIKILRDHGIEIRTGLLESYAMKQNKIFIKNITCSKPLITLKLAETLDGKIATKTGKSKWISSEESRNLVHLMRNKYMALMVGVNTIIKDLPALNTRLEDEVKENLKYGPSNPRIIIIDSRGRTPRDWKLFKEDPERLIFVTSDLLDKDYEAFLLEKAIKIIKIKNKEGHVDLSKLPERLAEEGIDSLMIEGGGEINYSALMEGIVDDAYFFISPKILGGRKARTAVEGPGVDELDRGPELIDMEVLRIDKDILIKGRLG